MLPPEARIGNQFVVKFLIVLDITNGLFQKIHTYFNLHLPDYSWRSESFHTYKIALFYFKEMLIHITIFCCAIYFVGGCSLCNPAINVINIANLFFPVYHLSCNLFMSRFFVFNENRLSIYQFFFHCFWVSWSITKCLPTLKNIYTCMNKILYFLMLSELFLFNAQLSAIYFVL